MDTNKFFAWLKTIPFWARIVVLIALGAVVTIATMSFVACGTMTSATIRNIQPNTQTQISISNNTNMDTDVNTDASATADFS